MSQSGSFNRLKGSGSAIIQINGDTGFITGNTVTIYANQAAINSGSSVSFDNSGTISTFNVTDGSLNTLIGQNCGTAAPGNDQNTGLGYNVLASSVNCIQNAFFGAFSGQALVNGTDNTGVGVGAFSQLVSGSENIGLGKLAGSHYTGAEGSNICIGNVGSIGESHVIRLGSQGSLATQQNKCFISGIIGVSVSNAQLVTINSSTTQLGVSSSTPIIAWTDESSDFSAVAGNGYFVTITCQANLAASPSQGDTISFVVDSSTGVLTIKANTGQFIRLGTSTTIAAGTAKNTSVTGYGNTITLVFRSSDTTWWSLNSTGTWTLT